MVEAAVAVVVAGQADAGGEEVVPGPVVGGVGGGGGVEQRPVVEIGHRREVLGEGEQLAVHAADLQHRGVELVQIELDALGVGLQVDEHVALDEGRDVDRVEQDDVGRGVGGHRGEDLIEVARRVGLVDDAYFRVA